MRSCRPPFKTSSTATPPIRVRPALGEADAVPQLFQPSSSLRQTMGAPLVCLQQSSIGFVGLRRIELLVHDADECDLRPRQQGRGRAL